MLNERPVQDIHIWEHKGYGKAPFRCVGMYSIPSPSLGEANPEAYRLALSEMPRGINCGSCRICGMPLVHNYIIKDACGIKFVVGCECVEKAGDAGLKSKVKLLERDRQAKIRHEKQAAKNKILMEEYKVKMDKQRKDNGGLTDYELLEKTRTDAAKQKVDNFMKILCNSDEKDIERTKMMYLDGGHWTQSIYEEMFRRHQMPHGRAIEILIEMRAKQFGRYGSKGFDMEYNRIMEALQ